MDKNRSAIVEQILREIQRLNPTLGDEQTRLLSQRFLAGDEEALLFLFLKILRRVNPATPAPSPSTPSWMIPPHLKASAQTGYPAIKRKRAANRTIQSTFADSPDPSTAGKNTTWTAIPTAAAPCSAVTANSVSASGSSNTFPSRRGRK